MWEYSGKDYVILCALAHSIVGGTFALNYGVVRTDILPLVTICWLFGKTMLQAWSKLQSSVGTIFPVSRKEKIKSILKPYNICGQYREHFVSGRGRLYDTDTSYYLWKWKRNRFFPLSLNSLLWIHTYILVSIKPQQPLLSYFSNQLSCSFSPSRFKYNQQCFLVYLLLSQTLKSILQKITMLQILWSWTVWVLNPFLSLHFDLGLVCWWIPVVIELGDY